MTLYEILEVSEKASNEVIEKAYKTLAKKYHPDLQQTSEEKKKAEKKMQEINEAYETLKDENRRNEYDKKLQAERDKQTEYWQYENTQRNIKRSQSTGEKENTNPNINYNENNNNYRSASEWQKILAGLPQKDREKLMKKIQKEAKEEYTRVAENYYRQKGYIVKHKTTAREYLIRFITVMIIVFIFIIMWIIPPTRKWMIGIYNENVVIKLMVDMIVSLIKAVFNFKN